MRGFRKKLSRSASKRVFRKTVTPKAKNLPKFNSRTGIRL